MSILHGTDTSECERQANYSQLACIYYCKTSTYMPERKRPIVAIVAAHERRKTVDDMLNTMSFTTEVANTFNHVAGLPSA